MRPHATLALLAAALFSACGGRTETTSSAPAVPAGPSGDAGDASVVPSNDATPVCSNNLDADPQNCGTCGHSCAPGTCTGGRCQPALLGSVPGSYGSFGLALSDSYVVFTTVEGSLYRVAKGGGPVTKLAGGPPDGMSMRNRDGVVVQQGTAYYSIYYAGVVRAVPLAGGAATDIAIDGPMGLVGVGSTVLAVTDRSPPWSITPNGSAGELALTGDAGMPYSDGWSAAADATFLYFAQEAFTAAGGAGLWRAPIAGGPVEVVARLPPTAFAGVLRSDATSLYCVSGLAETAGPFQVLRFSKADWSPTVRASDIAYEAAIAIDGESLFYVTKGTKAGQEAWGLSQVSKNGGAPTELVAPTTAMPMSIAADARAIYWTAQNGVFVLAK